MTNQYNHSDDHQDVDDIANLLVELLDLEQRFGELHAELAKRIAPLHGEIEHANDETARERAVDAYNTTVVYWANRCERWIDEWREFSEREVATYSNITSRTPQTSGSSRDMLLKIERTTEGMNTFSVNLRTAAQDLSPAQDAFIGAGERMSQAAAHIRGLLAT